ncbi:hypothetical protein EP073_10715 [Geovibrio thiophilus]|uniref:Uncharacterized protein n=1 Tax=Geovibrio thiophilus TaxID=139438 RepID=A0A3R5XXT8_9BACT|nr:hypothetical protein [Geovibrio thiophilus]QAR33854.1 hypothetical protein EP073_10715 [Geovibrio thiophilus]
MKTVSKLYTSQMSHEEIFGLEMRGRELRSEAFHKMLGSLSAKTGRLFRKALHIDSHGKLHHNARA